MPERFIHFNNWHHSNFICKSSSRQEQATSRFCPHWRCHGSKSSLYQSFLFITQENVHKNVIGCLYFYYMIAPIDASTFQQVLPAKLLIFARVCCKKGEHRIHPWVKKEMLFHRMSLGKTFLMTSYLDPPQQLFRYASHGLSFLIWSDRNIYGIFDFEFSTVSDF